MGDNRFASAEKGIPIQHYDAAATVTFHLDIRTGADYGPFVRTARMGFAGFYNIAN